MIIIIRVIIRFLRNLLKRFNYKLIYLKKHKNFTIISNNCIAGFIYHDLNIEYTSPTVGLQFSQQDYVKFCKSFFEYINNEIIESSKKDMKEDQVEFEKLGGGIIDFPVGKLDDLTIYFQHYETFIDAIKKWNRRKKRTYKNNLFFVFLAYDTTPQTLLDDFNNIDHPNKIILTNSKRTDAKNEFPLFNGDKSWYDKINFKKRYYQKFDFLDWIYRESKKIEKSY